MTEPTEAELLWAPLTDESATGEDWRALAPDGASPELLAALEAANELKAAARRMGAPQSRQKVLASLATLTPEGSRSRCLACAPPSGAFRAC